MYLVIFIEEFKVSHFSSLKSSVQKFQTQFNTHIHTL